MTTEQTTPSPAAAPHERFLKATPRACAAARRNLDRILASKDALAITAALGTLDIIAKRLELADAR